MSEWQPIESAPRESREMYVVRGFNVDGGFGIKYNTDPYAVWHLHNKFVRWPHKFQPTHWMPLPPPPSA